jgi:hypothetical protein
LCQNADYWIASSSLVGKYIAIYLRGQKYIAIYIAIFQTARIYIAIIAIYCQYIAIHEYRPGSKGKYVKHDPLAR